MAPAQRSPAYHRANGIPNGSPDYALPPPALAARPGHRPVWHTAQRTSALAAAVLAVCGLLLMLRGYTLKGIALPVPSVIDPAVLQSMPHVPDECPAALRKRIAWGVATSAYQIEGAWNEDGKGVSIWDTFVRVKGKVANNDTGDVAADHYHRYKEDVALMKSLGIKHYRLSLSWPRILPQGGRGTPINWAGIAFYKRLLQELLAAGITPVVTLYHWDLPQPLQELYGGFIDTQLSEDFAYYADVVFEHLGPYVQHWLTFNEPMSICQLGYASGLFAPGFRGGNWKLYRCGHTLLIAHGLAARLYRGKYQEQQGGRISMVISGHWGIPYNATSPEDQAAASAFVEWQVAWMADPLYKGDYPAPMRAALKHMLPTFKKEEVAMINGSTDFFALNFYTAHYVKAPKASEAASQAFVEVLEGDHGQAIGPPSDVFWLFDTPWAMRSMLGWVSDRYRRPELWVTENGVAAPEEGSKPLAEALVDTYRLKFYQGYLANLCKAVAQDGVNLSAYFAWSLMDNFEWADGFRPRFGITYVDYQDDLKRHPKLSAHWLSQHFFRPGASSIPCANIQSCPLPETQGLLAHFMAGSNAIKSQLLDRA